jgi:ubiquinone biosynthesis protein
MNWHDLLEESAVAELLSEKYQIFSKPVCDGLAVFLQGLSGSRQAAIVAEQAKLDSSVTLAARLGVLARSCPVLQKIGQILARDQCLSPELRQHLRQLESLPSTIPLEVIEDTLLQELGPLERLDITLLPPALAEASVAVVIPFCQMVEGKEQEGVFKILKPGIEDKLEEELLLLERVGSHLDDCCDELQIPSLDYRELFQQVREKLKEEIHLDREQQKLVAAQQFYADEDRVLIPALFDCCTPRVTAMQRIWGHKVTDHHCSQTRDARRLAKLVVKSMIAQPLFANQSKALFHSDPHAGNLFLTSDGRLAILDWSLVGQLNSQDRATIVQIMLGAILHDERHIVSRLSEIGESDSLDQLKLLSIVRRWLKKLRRGQFPGLAWLVGLLDEAVGNAHLRIKPDLVMFRKSLYTLVGVVAEVSDLTGVFDKVLCLEFMKHFLKEWPQRWLTMPNSREYATHLSNVDLTRAILGYPNALLRFSIGKSLDFWDDCRHSANSTSQRSFVE